MKTKRIRKPIAKQARSSAFSSGPFQDAWADRPSVGAHRCGCLLQREPDECRTRQIEGGEGQEVGGDAERVGDGGRHQSSEEIAGDIARHIGGERTGRLPRGKMLGQVGHRQRERSRHAQALRHAQEGEDDDAVCLRKQRRRDRQDGQADPDAIAAIDAAPEECDGDPGHRHAERAGIDGEAHGGAADAEFYHQ